MPERKLADRIRDAIRLRGYSIRTEKAYLHSLVRTLRPLPQTPPPRRHGRTGG